MNLAAAAQQASVYLRAFAHQAALINDPARKKSLLCPRRAGKSEGGGLYMILEALRMDGVNCLYVGLTRDTAKDIMWDKLKDILDECEVPYKANETELTITFHNRSRIKLFGLDANEGMKAKVLGGKYRLVILDEAASFRTDIRSLVKVHLKPALGDHSGTVVMMGTPDPDEARGFFYEVTTGKEPGWSQHTWTTFDNPHMADIRRAELAEIHAEDPLFENTDEYRCMYLGLWPQDQNGRVYAFDRERNLVDAAPELQHWVLAIDLGWDDDTSIVETGWPDGDPTLYVTHAEKCPEMGLEEIADRIRRRVAGKRDVRLVVDGANKQLVMELRNRYGLPLISTEKTEKVHHIRIVNDDMRRGRILIVRGACLPLVTEWTGCDEAGIQVANATALVWDARALSAKVPRKVEDPRCANHCADGFLYAHRFSRAWREATTVPKPEPGSAGAMAMELAEARRRKHRALQEQRRWENGD